MIMKGLFEASILLVACLQAVSAKAKRPEFVTDEIMELIKDDKQKCMAEHGTTEELIDEVNEGHVLNDPRITCYMHCMLEAFSLVDEDGELEIEMMVGLVPEEFQEIAEELIEQCAKLKGNDVCEHMYVRAKCVQEKKPESRK